MSKAYFRILVMIVLTLGIWHPIYAQNPRSEKALQKLIKQEQQYQKRFHEVEANMKKIKNGTLTKEERQELLNHHEGEFFDYAPYLLKKPTVVRPMANEMPTTPNNVFWHIDTLNVYGGEGHAWWCGRNAESGFVGYWDEWIQYLWHDFDLSSASGTVTLEFENFYDTENNYDGGYVEVSTDGGNTYQLVEPDSGYPGQIWRNKCTQQSVPAWTGVSGGGNHGEGEWVPATFDLSSFAGQNIRIRFTFISDYSVHYLGWFIDNVHIYDESGDIFTDDVESGAGDWQADYPFGAVSGVVYDEDGVTPLSNAEIYIYNSDNGNWIAVAWSDNEGNFLLEGLCPGNYKFRARAANHVTEYYDNVTNWDDATVVAVSYHDTTGGIDFQLDKAGTIAGTVTDKEGNPLQDAWMYAWNATGNGNGGGVTDENGHYALSGDWTGFDTGKYIISADKDGFARVFYNGVYSWSQADSVAVTAGDTTKNIDFQLPKAGWVTGFVRDMDGNVLPNTDVSAFDVNTGNYIYGANSWDNGYYSVKLPPDLQFKIRTYKCCDFAHMYYNNSYLWEMADTVFVTAEDSTTGIDFNLPVVEDMTIAQAKSDADHDFVPDNAGKVIRVEGTVTSPNFAASDSANSYFIQNENMGIEIFSYRDFNLGLNKGRHVRVRGQLLEENGKERIYFNGWDDLNTYGTDPLPDPVVLSPDSLGQGVGEQYQARLAKMDSVTVVAGSFPPAGQDGVVDIQDDAGNQAHLWIDKDSQLDGRPTPTAKFSVIGIVDQEYGAWPTAFDGNYVLKPRYVTDIREAGADSLLITSSHLYDWIGNHDHQANPGEFFNGHFYATNLGDSAFFVKYAHLDSSYDPYVSPNSVYYFAQDLYANSTVSPGDSLYFGWFEFYAAPNTPDGHVLTIPVTFYGENDQELGKDTLRFVCSGTGDQVPPYVDWTWINQRYVPVGGTQHIETFVREAGNVAEVSLILKKEDGTPVATLTMHDDGQNGDCCANDRYFTVEYSPTFEANFIGDIYTRDEFGNDSTYSNVMQPFTSVPPPTASKNILLVDDDRSEYRWRISVEDYYKVSLDHLGKAYDVWNTYYYGIPDSSFLANYSDGLVIWETGTAGYTFRWDQTQNALRAYLNAGGNLFVTGKRIADVLNYDEPDFLHTYFHANFAGWPNLYYLSGQTGDPISDGINVDIHYRSNGDAANDQCCPEEIDPLDSAVPVFIYSENAPSAAPLQNKMSTRLAQLENAIRSMKQNPHANKDELNALKREVQVLKQTQGRHPEGIISSGTGGLRYEGNYKLVFFSFGFEGINGQSTRDLLMQRIVNWLYPTSTPITYHQYVNAGGNTYTDSHAHTWAADQAYAPGAWGYVGGTAYSKPDSIAGTVDDTLYQTERYGMTGYKFDVPNGQYQVTLHFAELFFNAPHKRVFDVSLEGQKVLENYDIFADVGKFTATSKTFLVNVTDGQLNIDFGAKINYPKVSAIEVCSHTALVNHPPQITSAPVENATVSMTYRYQVEATDSDGDSLRFHLPTAPTGMTIDSTGLITWTPAATDTGTKTIVVKVSDSHGGYDTQSFNLHVTMAPAFAIRINPGGGQYTDKNGNVWLADQAYEEGGFGYLGGTAWSTTAPIAGTSDDTLYQQERYSMTDYKFTLPDGQYRINLLFAENYFNAPGKRVFDVYLNGIPKLTNFDIFAEAGKNHALTKSFLLYVQHNATAKVAPKGFDLLVTNGVLDIHFVQKIENPKINGIEIIENQYPTNQPPVITSTPVTQATVGVSYTYDVQASDADGDTLSYSLLTHPVAMSINGSTGLISWIPDTTDAGDHNVEVKVTDNHGGEDTQSFVIHCILANTFAIRVNSGGAAFTDAAGHLFEADQPFTAGSWGYIGGHAWSTSHAISGTVDDTLYQFERYGMTAYKFTVPNGDYHVIFHFAENYWKSSGKRLFSVALEGTPVLSNLDLYSEAGGAFRAYDRDFVTNVTDSVLDVVFQASVNSPKINAIEVLSIQPGANHNPKFTTTPPTNAVIGQTYTYLAKATDADGDTLTYSLGTHPAGMTIADSTGAIAWIPDSVQVGDQNVTVNVSDGKGGMDSQSFVIHVQSESLFHLFVNAGGSNYTDKAGNLWVADQPYSDSLGFGYVGGTAYVKSHPIGNTEDDPLYQTERYGMTEYKFNVPNGHYEITLLFAELYWNAPGKRVFSVSIEGVTRLANFDIFGAVGKWNAISKTYLATVTDGQLNLAFSAAVDHPKVAAIEVSGTNINTNQPPVITSTPQTIAIQGVQYKYDVEATDPEGDPITYSLKESPNGMTINSNTGLIQWVPTENDSGDIQVKVQASDGNGGTDVQEYFVHVSSPTAFQLRLNAGGNAYTDGNGNIWNADQAYMPGSWGYVNIDTSKTWATTADIANTDDDPLYQTERWGNFSYQFDLPNGNYTVALKFAELYWHAPGKRIFDVRIEGTTVIDDWDMYADIGYRTAASKIFAVNVSDNQLNIDFQASVDSAKVSAIEITGVCGAMAKRLAQNGGVMSAIPDKYGLSANYPNPFNPSTTIDYQLPETANVKMVIYDLLGRQIRILIDKDQEAGYHSAKWDGCNDSGMPVSAGIYILKFKANAYTAIRKMIFMK